MPAFRLAWHPAFARDRAKPGINGKGVTLSAKGYYKRHNDNGRLTALRALHSALRKERAA